MVVSCGVVVWDACERLRLSYVEVQPLGGLRPLFVLELPLGASDGQRGLGVHMAAKGSLGAAHVLLDAVRVVAPRHVGDPRPHEPPRLALRGQLDQFQGLLQWQRGLRNDLGRSHGAGGFDVLMRHGEGVCHSGRPVSRVSCLAGSCLAVSCLAVRSAPEWLNRPRLRPRVSLA